MGGGGYQGGGGFPIYEAVGIESNTQIRRQGENSDSDSSSSSSSLEVPSSYVGHVGGEPKMVMLI